MKREYRDGILWSPLGFRNTKPRKTTGLEWVVSGWQLDVTCLTVIQDGEDTEVGALSCSCRTVSEGYLKIHTHETGPAASPLPQHCLQILPTSTVCYRFSAPWMGGVWSRCTPHTSAAWLHFSLQESTNILCPDTEEEPKPEKKSVFSKETTSSLRRIFQSQLMWTK